VKKLKVTWQDGSWNHGGQQPVASAEIQAEELITAVVGETLVFRALGKGDGSHVNGPVLLIIPEGRLISAIPVIPVEEGADNA